MNRKIGMAGSAVNFVSVIGFAVSMPFFFSFGNYLFSMLIAFSFVMMMCGFAFYAGERRKLAGLRRLPLPPCMPPLFCWCTLHS